MVSSWLSDYKAMMRKNGPFSLLLALGGLAVPAIVIVPLRPAWHLGPFEEVIVFTLLATPIEAFAYALGGRAVESQAGSLGRRVSTVVLLCLGFLSSLALLLIVLMAVEGLRQH